MSRSNASALKALKVIIVVAVIIVAVIFATGVYMVRYALQDGARCAGESQAWEKMEYRYPGLQHWHDSLRTNGILKDTSLVFGSRKLVAYYAEADSSERTAMIVHGYSVSPIEMMMIARLYRDSLGYNIWLPALHFHGGSDGEAAQMGWFDRFDVQQWCSVAHERFCDTMQVVHGISMGAATTMMLSGDPTPDYIKGFVEDCGYTSVWDEFKGELKKKYGLPAFPVLNAASLVCRMKYGWSFKEASSVNQLKKSVKPVMFIHGDNDTFVPSWMVYENYAAKTEGYKEIWVTEGCSHTMSYHDYPEEYTSRLRNFLEIVAD